MSMGAVISGSSAKKNAQIGERCTHCAWPRIGGPQLERCGSPRGRDKDGCNGHGDHTKHRGGWCALEAEEGQGLWGQPCPLMPSCEIFPSYPKRSQQEVVPVEVTEALLQQEKSWGPVEPGLKQYKVWVDQAGLRLDD